MTDTGRGLLTDHAFAKMVQNMSAQISRRRKANVSSTVQHCQRHVIMNRRAADGRVMRLDPGVHYDTL